MDLVVRYFPSYFDIRDQPVLIVGGGPEALRKARLLSKAGPRLNFIAPELDPEIEAEFGGQATMNKRHFEEADLTPRPSLAVIANNNPPVDARLAEIIRAANVPVNVVDRPDLSDFVVPAIVDRGDLVVGISSGGTSPILARSIRAKIETMLPQRLSVLTTFAAGFRKAVSAKFYPHQRRLFWERFFSGPAASLVISGREAEARALVMRELNTEHPTGGIGFVHIVGAGPGDPELLTLKALRILQEADVVLYDNLVSEEVLELIRRDAHRIYVGKRKSNHSVTQEKIGELLVQLSSEGKKVVRLKGGDPFVFGRGGEEVDALIAANVPVEVVPGITAAAGCAAAAAIPLTHRDFAQAVTYITGHAKGDSSPDLDWVALARPNHTLVVYMGVGSARSVATNLMDAGMNKATPVAIIENGTTRDQKVLRTDIINLSKDLEVNGIKGPAVLIIGEVAAKASGAGLMDLSESEKLRA